MSLSFNSFTQELCAEETVRRVQDEQALGESSLSQTANVAEHVSRTTKFVEHMSELADVMNTSGM